MKKTIVVNLLLTLLFALHSSGIALAQQPAYQVPATPPQPPEQFIPEPDQPAETPDQTAALSLPPLKAVLLVGPIDGATGSWTRQEVANSNKAAAVLLANGVQVYRFYPPGNGYDYSSWSQVVQAASGAHFIYYRGHGVYMGSVEYPTVGGFYLMHTPQNSQEDGTYFVSSDKIRTDLRPAENFIVMLYGCFTAGSSSSDPAPITLTEAQRRVVQYSQPFFDIGAGGYYADWFGDAFEKLTQSLFAGKTQQQVYEGFYDYSAANVSRTTYPNHPEWALWLDKDYWNNRWEYNYAFAGLASATLEGLFQPLTMVVSHDTVSFLGQNSDTLLAIPVNVQSAGQGTFTYTATLENLSGPAANWVSLEQATPITFGPITGPDDDTLMVFINPAGKPLGTYTANLHIKTTTPNVVDADQIIPVQMVLYQKVSRSYLPLLNHP